MDDVVMIWITCVSVAEALWRVSSSLSYLVSHTPQMDRSSDHIQVGTYRCPQTYSGCRDNSHCFVRFLLCGTRISLGHMPHNSVFTLLNVIMSRRQCHSFMVVAVHLCGFLNDFLIV